MDLSAFSNVCNSDGACTNNLFSFFSVSYPVERARVLLGHQVVLAQHQVQDERRRREWRWLIHAEHAHAGEALLRHHFQVVESCRCSHCSGSICQKKITTDVNTFEIQMVELCSYFCYETIMFGRVTYARRRLRREPFSVYLIHIL